jgi:hypothetical protein
MSVSLAGVRQLAIDSDPLSRWITAIVVGALLVARRPESLLRPQLWAEDGPIFYLQELTTGAAHTLFEPYAGYLQFVPRLASIVAAHFPAIVVPVLYAFVAYASAIWACSLFVESSFAGLVASRALRFMVCCLIAVVPPASELLGSITNAHRYLSLGTFLLLLGDPAGTSKSRARTIWGVVVVFAATLSGAETLFFVPLALWRVFRSRSMSARAIPIALIVGSVAQIVALKLDPVHGGPSPHATLDATVFATVDAFIHRVFVAAFGGQGTAEFIDKHGLDGLALILLMIPTSAVTVILMRFARIRGWIVVFLALSFVSIGTALDGRNLVVLFPGLTLVTYGGERYFLMPIVLLLLGVAMTLNQITQLSSAAKCLCFGALFAGGFVLNFRQPDVPDLHWPAYATDVDRWIVAERAGKSTPGLTVPINPPGWALRLPPRPAQ